MKILIIKSMIACCIVISLLYIAIGAYKLVARNEQLDWKDLIHIPYHPGDLLCAKAAHNIIDGLGGLFLSWVIYQLFISG